MPNNTNPFESILKRTELLLTDVRNIQANFENVRRKRIDVNQREAALLKDAESLTSQEEKVKSEIFILLNSLGSFLQETVSYSHELYKRNQAEIQYRMQAEAAQRALAESASKVVSDAAERANAEAEYRKQAKLAQEHLAKQALRAQSDAAKRIQQELSYAPVNTMQFTNTNQNKSTMERTDSNLEQTGSDTEHIISAPEHISSAKAKSFEPKKMIKDTINKMKNTKKMTRAEVITLESITSDRANRIDNLL